MNLRTFIEIATVIAFTTLLGLTGRALVDSQLESVKYRQGYYAMEDRLNCVYSARRHHLNIFLTCDHLKKEN